MSSKVYHKKSLAFYKKEVENNTGYKKKIAKSHYEFHKEQLKDFINLQKDGVKN